MVLETNENKTAGEMFDAIQRVSRFVSYRGMEGKVIVQLSYELSLPSGHFWAPYATELTNKEDGLFSHPGTCCFENCKASTAISLICFP